MTIARSYDFDRFSDADRRAELQRLRRQATLVIDVELALLQKLGLRAGQRAIEIGCGPGFVTGAIADVVGAGGEAVGLDASRELVDAARAIVAPEHPNVRFVAGDAYATGLDAAAFDFVYSRLVYQHLTEPARALAEAQRVTRPGGRVCIADVDDGVLFLEPTCDAFERLTALAADAQRKNGGDRRIGRKLVGMMRDVGFRDVAIDLVAVSSLAIGIRAFLDITTRFKAIQIGTPEALDLVAATDAYAAERGERLLGVVGVFVVAGTR